MVHKSIPVFCLILALSLCSCSKELNRSKAQSLLNESEALKSWKPKVTVQRDKWVNPACIGIFSRSKERGNDMQPFYEVVSLSAKGQQYFAGLRGTFGPCDPQGMMCSVSVLLNKQVGEVTGIAGSGDSERNVEFTVRYEYPEEVLNCTGKFPDAAAKATFHLYDNGWRVMKVGNP